FIDQGLVGQAGYVEILAPLEAAAADFVRRPLANDKQLPLKSHVILDLGIAPDKHLAHERLRLARRRAQGNVACRHGAPSEKALAFLSDNGLEELLAFLPLRRVLRKEHNASAILAWGGQFN